MLARPQIDFQRTPVTLSIALIAVAIELVCSFDPARRDFFYNELRLGIWWQIWTGELWRPLTTTLLHGGILHAAFNVYWLTVFGPAVELEFGSSRTFGLFVLLAYLSSLPQYIISGYIEPGSGALVGLSGVLYGFFGFCWAGSRCRGLLAAACDPATVQIMFGWFVFCLALGVVGRVSGFYFMHVANIAHVAGLVFGLLYGHTLCQRQRRPLWLALSTGLTLVVLATLIACPGHPGYEYARRFAALR